MIRRLLVAGWLLLAVPVFAGGGDVDPFAPDTAATVTVSVTNSSAATALKATGRAQVMVYNAGAQTAFIEFGLSGQTAATTTGLPIPAGAIYVLSIPTTTTHIAAITASSTATVYVTVGRGN